MFGSRLKLRVLYLALCAAQLVVTGFGLVLAYQVERSYSQNIDIETSVNAEHRAIAELEVLARDASPGNLDLDDSSSVSSQLSQTDYASKVFLRKVQGLLEDLQREPNSPVARSQADLHSMVSQMGEVAEQTKEARVALDANNGPLLRARLTYLDRDAARVLTTLGNINQDMSRSKDEVLIRENAEARHARMVLRPLSIAGILLIIPALLYARRLDKNIWTYEMELEKERGLLENRVATRTSELRNEIERRKSMEVFNGHRNRLLEKVAEGKELDDVLTQLTEAAEKSVTESRCLVLLSGAQRAIAPNVSPDLADYLGTKLIQSWDGIPSQGRGIVFIQDEDQNVGTTFADVWSQGFRSILAVPVTEPQQALLGVVVLLLRGKSEPDDFSCEVLLSASRLASIASEHSRMQDELLRRAHYDPLTDLPNRLLFEDRFQQAIALAGRRGGNVGVLCIDLDGFKEVNDQHGHQAGDWLLQEVAKRLSSILRKSDTIARLGGDEFVAVIHDTQPGDGIAKVSESLVGLLAGSYSFGNVTLRTTASIGISVYPADGTSCADLRRNADLAMYRAKERGGNTYQMFSADLGDRLARRKLIEQHLEEALENDGFELLYQPIYKFPRILAGLEALIRFGHADLKSISPGEFIQVAEQTGQISRIGDWVLREACRQCKQWQTAGLVPVPIAVNVSAIQLIHPDFAEQAAEILREIGLDPAWLRIEITETALMSDFDEAARQLFALAGMGVHISIDDFGTGHSSLSYIHRLPISTLKIDRSFVQSMVGSDESKAIVRAIVAMAQSLEIAVVAEGVETAEQLWAVMNAGCDSAQGYHFAKPLDRVTVGTLVENQSFPAQNIASSIR